jgi:hypothetical protein
MVLPLHADAGSMIASVSISFMLLQCAVLVRDCYRDGMEANCQ